MLLLWYLTKLFSTVGEYIKMVEGHISQQTQPTKFNIKIFCLSFASQQFLLTSK